MSSTNAAEEIKTWERTYVHPGGGNAFVHFAVFGEIDQPLAVSQSKYRIDGVPDGIDVSRTDLVTDDDLRIDRFFRTFTDDALNQQDSPLYHSVRLAQSMMEVVGLVRDPQTLDYLRNVIGIVTCIAESGGQAVLDINSRKWFRPDAWRAQVFDPNQVVFGQHVTAYVTTQGRGPLNWIRTRGMLTFGRPDLSIRDVPPSAVEQVIELCGRFTKLFAMGAVPTDGQEVKMGGFPAPLKCRLTPAAAANVGDIEIPNATLDIKFPLSTGGTGPLTRRPAG